MQGGQPSQWVKQRSPEQMYGIKYEEGQVAVTMLEGKSAETK
jgi:hypothetical protein